MAVIDEKDQQRIRDEEHVKLLGIFYCISGGLTALFGLFPLIYVFLGAMLAIMPEIDDAEGQAAARLMGAMFTTMGFGFFLVAQAFAGLKIFAGLSLLRRRRRIACLVIAGIACLGIPYSTILGVFTFVVLLRDSTRALFEESEADATATHGSPT